MQNNHLYTGQPIGLWQKRKLSPMLRRIILWTLLALIMRILIGAFYKDTAEVMNWLTFGLLFQTITTYYLFGYVVFPRFVYKKRILPAVLCIVLLHVLVYWSNYGLFDYLHRIDHGPRIERDWGILKQAGVTGFATNALAALWSIFYSLPFPAMLLGVLAVKDILSYRLNNLRLERDNLNLELSFLKSQVNPHFLFNTLNSVYGRIFETDELAADLVLRLSELMRYNLYEADVPQIALAKELAYIRNYLDLESNRLLGEDVLIDYQQEGEPTTQQIAPLLLIAFVENAFKHGVKAVHEAAFVKVGVTLQQNLLTFTVENSLPPKRRRAGQLKDDKPSGGLGLSNVKRRLDAIYSGQYEFNVIPGELTYRVDLAITLNS